MHDAEGGFDIVAEREKIMDELMTIVVGESRALLPESLFNQLVAGLYRVATGQPQIVVLAPAPAIESAQRNKRSVHARHT